MSQFNAQVWITPLFLRLRQRGYLLGVDEYRAGLQAVEAGYGQDEAAFLEMVQILWCHSRSQQNQLVPIWQSLQREVNVDEVVPKTRLDAPSLPPSPPKLSHEANLQAVTPDPPVQKQETLPKQEVFSVPVQAPFTPVERGSLLPLQSYFPISRRSMIYGWRFLQRKVTDGCRDVLDIPATIQKVTEQGYYLSPVYRRRQRNQARLLLLIDQNGSMTPFHRFSRDLVETALEERSFQEGNIQVFYFHNIPTAYLYRDLYLTQPIPAVEVLNYCDRDTSVLIVSDAGAARGYRRQERIQETTQFLLKLQKRTPLVAWLNPMSRPRWAGSSAEILSYLVPMFQVDRLGFGEAIDVVRGVTLSSTEEDDDKW